MGRAVNGIYQVEKQFKDPDDEDDLDSSDYYDSGYCGSQCQCNSQDYCGQHPRGVNQGCQAGC